MDEQKIENGFEFLLNGEEAMVLMAQQQQGPYYKEWVYLVSVGWSSCKVMTEGEIDWIVDPIDIYADNHPRWDGD